MLRMEELLDRLGADLAAPVDTLEEVGGCWVNRATITVLMFPLPFFLWFLLYSQRTPDAELRSLSGRGGEGVGGKGQCFSVSVLPLTYAHVTLYEAQGCTMRWKCLQTLQI